MRPMRVHLYVCQSRARGFFFFPFLFLFIFSRQESDAKLIYKVQLWGRENCAAYNRQFLRTMKFLCSSFSFFSLMYHNLLFLTCPNYYLETYRGVWTQTVRNPAYDLSFTAGTHLTIFWWVFAAMGSIQAVWGWSPFALAKSLEIKIIGVLEERCGYSEIFL